MKQRSLDEMAILNNELANTQRVLIKQNAEIKILNDRLQSMNTELEQFTYVASHDLREPLRMITGFMGLLKKKYGNQFDDKANLYMDFALDGGRKMQAMIEDLLELSRSGMQSGMRLPIDLNDVLAEVKQNLFRVIKNSDAAITLRSKLPVLPAYRPDMISIFQNLLSNAIKFRNKETAPLIYIDAEERQTDWLFSIKDNGLGIDEENEQKIFEVFTRLHTKKEYEGTGIGLAICKKIAEQYGGRVWFKSAPGKGTTFYLTLST